MKRLLCILLTLALTVGFAACGNSAGTDQTEETAQDKPAFKIGVITGTVSQQEEEYRAAENVKARYGDMIIQTTWPDNFVKEQETFIANVMSMAMDPDCKAILISQGIPGTCAAVDKVKEVRPDIYFIVNMPGEDPDMISSKADLIMQADEYNMGYSMIEQAQKFGAKTFIQYSFPRHMSYPILSARRDLFKKNCAEAGIEYVDVTAPDPTGDAGITGTQQFMMEDIPREIAKYGKDTVIYGTNCSMQEPIIKQVVDNGALYVLPCCPGPWHGFPSALGIDIPNDKKADIAYTLDQIKTKLSEKNMLGRVSTWAVPVNMLTVEGGVDYLVEMLNGNTNGEKIDMDVLNQCLGKRAAEMSGDKGGQMELQMAPYSDLATNKTYDNFLMIQEEYYTFQ